jgi:hypothetical protein
MNFMVNASNNETAITPSTTAESISVPAGWKLLYDENGKPAIIKEEDVQAFSAQHGLVAQKYDLDAARSAFDAAATAFPQIIHDAVEEFSTLSYVREDTFGAVSLAMGKLVDAYKYLMASVGALLPTENQVVDAAIHAKEHGGLGAMHQGFRDKFEHLISKVSDERIEFHTNRASKDEHEAGFVPPTEIPIEGPI